MLNRYVNPYIRDFIYKKEIFDLMKEMKINRRDINVFKLKVKRASKPLLVPMKK